MLGAIAGDVIGSVFEFNPIKTTRFELFTPQSRFTDDTVMTVAVADCLLHHKDYAQTFKEYGRKYPHAGYGARFRVWLESSGATPYNSYGNGSAMRVSPVGFTFNDLESVLREAEKSAAPTHNHPEGIKGAQAAAAAVFMARNGSTKTEIKEYVQTAFGYDLQRTLDQVRPDYRFDETCQGTVPQAIRAFLESNDYEDAVRKAISLGGDSDTLACIAGGIAEAFYGAIPEEILRETRRRLNTDLLKVVDEFDAVYNL